jgi:hypothetical protein
MLRDFIKHVNVDRKYTGEKSIVKLPTLRLVSFALLYTHAHGSYRYFKFSLFCCEKLVQQLFHILLTLANSTILDLINLDLIEN